MGWDRKFDDPMPHGIVTLRDAANHITKLPKKEQDQTQWQIAIEMLILAAEDRGPMLHARIGMLKALNHGEVRVFKESGKAHHWGKRKLNGDE
jgi:hypothetical protein